MEGGVGDCLRVTSKFEKLRVLFFHVAADQMRKASPECVDSNQKLVAVNGTHGRKLLH
jgi:hypothetical protein